MKLKRVLTLLLLLLVLGFIFVFSAVKTGALDFWMHLAAGRLLVQSQSFPLNDPFTYTAGNSSWINGWWLSQVIFYLLRQGGGTFALIFLKALLITSLWALLLKLSFDNGIKLSIAVLLVLLGALAGQESWGLKPHFFTFFLFALTYYVLYQARRESSPLPWALVPLFAFWANLHPGYPAGLLLILLFMLERSNAVRTNPQKKGNWGKELASLGLFGGAAVLACFFTPYGFKGFWQPFAHVKDTGLLKFLGEWASPYFLYPAFYPFEFLLLLLLVTALLSAYRPSLFEICSILIFGHMALQSFRHIPLFAIVVILPLGKIIMGFTSESNRRHWLTCSILSIAALVFIFISPAWQGAAKAGFVRELEENNPFLPTKAVKILQTSSLPGPFFSTYSWNGYEIWSLSGKYKVFIDGRTPIYPPQVLRDYLQLQEAGYWWELTLKKYGINVILVDNGLPLARLLSLSPHWRKVYEDSLAAVYCRQTPKETDTGGRRKKSF